MINLPFLAEKSETRKSKGWKRKLDDRNSDDLLDFIEQTIDKVPRIAEESGM